MIGRRRALALLLAGAGGLLARPRDARADTLYELLPTLSAGVTSNAAPTGTSARDELTTLSALGRIQYRGPRMTNVVGDRAAFSHYFQGNGTDTFSNELLALSTITLTSLLELHLNASLVLSRTSAVGGLGLVTPQASANSASMFLASNAGEELGWQASPGWRLSESFQFNRVDYPFSDPVAGRHPAMAFASGGRVDYAHVLDTFSLDVRATDFVTEASQATGGAPAVPGGQSLFAQALLGWRRDLSREWFSTLEAGAAYYSNGPGTDLYVPAGQAVLAYRLRTWFATLEASQVPVVNMLAALVTINDQAFLRLTLPVTERELVAVSAFAGYIYARGADAQANLSRAFDQQSVGARLSAMHDHLPLAISLDYAFINQNGGPGVGGIAVPDLVRHTIMLSITSALSFGPNTPPLLESGRLMLPER